MFFEKPGKGNTEQTLQLAAAKGKELGLDEAVVATTSGETAYRAMEIIDELEPHCRHIYTGAI